MSVQVTDAEWKIKEYLWDHVKNPGNGSTMPGRCEMRKMKKKRQWWILLFMVCLCLGAGQAFCETVYYINPNGGMYYHLDPNCPTVHPKYRPLPVSMTKEELEQLEGNVYSPCNVCLDEDYVPPEELWETDDPTEAPAWEMIIDPRYAEYALTDRYIREAPVFIDEHDMLAKAGSDPEGYGSESRYLQWYRDGKLFREIECKYRDPARWWYEGVFLSLPDGGAGLAAIGTNALNFFRWGEEGLTLEKEIPGKWIELYGNTKAVCAIRPEENGIAAHLFDPAGQEIWTYQFSDPIRQAGWHARPTGTDEAGTYVAIVRAESDLLTACFIRDGKTVAQQNLRYGGSAFYAGDQTYILAETTSGDHQ